MNRIVVETVTKDCRHGRFTFMPHDAFVGRSLDVYGEFAEHEVQLFQKLLRPGDVVVEAGANIGALTVPIARAVGAAGKVIAYEPQGVLAHLLAANLAANGLANVEVRRAGLGAASGTIRVPAIDYSRAGNFGGVSIGAPAETRGHAVALETLDGLGLAALAFVKIDVEGMELAVLEGGDRTVRALRPILFVENDRTARSAALIAHLLALGYALWWHITPLFNRRNFFGATEDVVHGVCSFNMLCLPPERGIAIANGLAVTGPDDDWSKALARAPGNAP